MTVPSVIRGFTVPADITDQAVRCGSRERGNVLGLEGITRSANNGYELFDAVECLLMASMFVQYIPVLAGTTWQRSHAQPSQGVGWLGLTTANHLLEPLREFRPQIDPVAETHFLAQAWITDENGVTNHALLTISAAPPARVDAVYVRERFEE